MSILLTGGEPWAVAAGAGADVRFVRLDVTDPASAAAAADRIDREEGVLDILVNNAGIVVRTCSGSPVVKCTVLTQARDVRVSGMAQRKCRTRILAAFK